MNCAFAQPMTGTDGQHCFQVLGRSGLLGCIFAGLDFGVIARFALLVQIWRRLCAWAMVKWQDKRLRRTYLALAWGSTGRQTDTKCRGANKGDKYVFHDDLLG